MPINAPISTVIPKDQRSPLDLRTSLSGVAAPLRQAFERIQQAHDALYRQMRTPQNVEEFEVTDPSGKVIFWAGTKVVNNVLRKGFWAYDGYLGGNDPASAPLSVINGVVTFSLGGSDDAAAIIVLDENGNEVVRIGKINDTPDEYGIYARAFKFGGPDVDNPIIFGDEEGLVTMEGATIRLGPGADGNGGVIEIYDATDALIATLGMYDAATGVAISTTNAGSVTNSVAHGLTPGNFARIAGSSNADHNRIWPVITTPTANTWTTTGMVGSGTGGTSILQDSGISLTAGGTKTTLDATDGLVINAGGVQIARLNSAYLEVSYPGIPGRTGIFNADQWSIAYESGKAQIEAIASITGSDMWFKNGSGTIITTVSSSGVSTSSLTLTTPLAVTYGGTGANNPSAALSNLGGTTLAAVQAWIASQGYLDQATADTLYAAIGHNHAGVYAPAVHGHSSMTITGTSGGGVAGHSHTGSVS